ncbi:MAG: hypothetical protein AVDCRST_MAG11-209 [uncultured Gemmatimonadaceae bacterium]|uniref:(S)-2-haloacid dehalogenase n=1 Tax=uncultured Gemmatimonadaceae bacterium TaxID=246130 RepID=A0A6J4K160_9BACT|nr:MAG: hypothetical protein AVDCRST_MAG11-209 [uncultured Gemmatimonadaceae bacterium]
MRAVLFDLNGTLLDPGDLAPALADALHLAHADGLTGTYRRLPEYLRAALEARDAEGIDAAVERAARMPAFGDAEAAVRTLLDAGLRCGVLTNSAAAAGRAALDAAGLGDVLDVVAGSDEAGAHKPDPRPYRLAVERLGLHADEVCLVAAHWWDVLGAARAGLRTGWVARGRRLPSTVPEPGARGEDLAGVAAALAGR